MQRGLAERLICLHDEIKVDAGLTALNRIAVALYDERSDTLKTFIHSSDGDSPFDRLSAKLSDYGTLQQLAWTGARRIVNDLTVAAARGQAHARRLVSNGYLASYTVPIQHRGNFYGFLFLNSFKADFFSPPVIQRLRPYVELIAMTVMRDLDTVQMMQAAVKVTRRVTSARDEETGAHLGRMASYARLIAARLAPSVGVSDEFIEFVYQFCPLHDVGKVAVPDSILLKPGALTADEFAVMKTHVVRGVEIIDMMTRDFGLGAMPHFDLLRNIVAFHHEAVDGSGYPYGRSGDEIPLEARIAAVADVFDALTSERPYKKAWTNDDAFALMRRLAGTKFDAECVEALLSRSDSVKEIQASFQETITD
jgi:HD-GYP domain-containing protein (c-di-GMP phosphodiesterase class II)